MRTHYRILGRMVAALAAALLAAAPAIAQQSTVGGSSSRPRFLSVGVNQAAPSTAGTIGISGGTPRVVLNATGTAPRFELQTSGTRRGFLSYATANNDFCNGTTSGDLCLGAAAGGIGFSINDGSTLTGRVSSGGNWTFNAPANGDQLVVTGAANAFTGRFTASSTVSQSYGPLIQAGTNTADYALTVNNQANTINFLRIDGAGGIQTGSPTGGAKGAGTINLAGHLYYNNLQYPLQRMVMVQLNGGAGCQRNTGYASNDTLASCTNSATGVYAVTFSSGWNTTPICTASLMNDNDPAVIMVSPQSTTTVNLYAYSTAFAATNGTGNANLICSGT